MERTKSSIQVQVRAQSPFSDDGHWTVNCPTLIRFRKERNWLWVHSNRTYNKNTIFMTWMTCFHIQSQYSKLNASHIKENASSIVMWWMYRVRCSIGRHSFRARFCALEGALKVSSILVYTQSTWLKIVYGKTSATCEQKKYRNSFGRQPLLCVWIV